MGESTIFARPPRCAASANRVAIGCGSVADAITLSELFEEKLVKPRQLERAAVRLARDWRGDRRCAS